MTRTLEITLRLTSETTFDVEIHEPETGDFVRVPCTDAGASVRGENARIAAEIRYWVRIAREAQED